MHVKDQIHVSGATIETDYLLIYLISSRVYHLQMMYTWSVDEN